MKGFKSFSAFKVASNLKKQDYLISSSKSPNKYDISTNTMHTYEMNAK